MTTSDPLSAYYSEVKTVILSRQHPVTGLLPASTAVNAHGDYRDAWVRDNVYSIMAVWGLAMAYRKHDEQAAKVFELEHSVIKLMRGLLTAMMRQADKVEAFKESLDPLDALHAKYDTATANVVVADAAWGHLQLDATSLYLLMLAQMTASGLTIIYSLDEVNFIQNLVFYLSQAYRTPDYGIWERGDKTNDGEAELNASSVAMAKAALEALAGFNVFGVNGDQASVIHVLPDDVARARITLEALLPRESSSKEVDAALLSVLSFPAFAVDDEVLANRTREKILSQLAGRYGFKRFLRDGHQTVLEDPHRLYYKAEELRQFEHIESEWPLFFTYLALDGFFRHDEEASQNYLAMLEQIAVTTSSFALLPELYFVPMEAIEAEKRQPQSQKRQANQNLPLVWAQSLWLLARLLHDKHISLADIDPLLRHQRKHHPEPVVQIAVLAEDEALRQSLHAKGYESETISDISPIKLRQSALLAQAYTQVGRNDKLALSGRPAWRILSLSSSRVFRLAGESVVFVPSFLDSQTFYLSLDSEFLLERFASELAYVKRNWVLAGRPTIVLLITHTLFQQGQDALLSLLDQLHSGQVASTAVKVAPLRLLLPRAAKERIDNLHGFSLNQQELVEKRSQPWLSFMPENSQALSQEEERQLEQVNDTKLIKERLKLSTNIYEQADLLESLVRQLGLDSSIPGETVSVRQLLEELYANAAELSLWSVLRRASGLLQKVDVAVTESVTDILVNQKAIVIGKAYHERSLIRRPIPLTELLQKMHEFCREDIRDFVLTQELLIYLSLLMKAEPQLFKGFLTIRLGHLILLLVTDLAQEKAITQDAAYDDLMRLSPSHIQKRLKQVLANYGSVSKRLEQQEAIQLKGQTAALVWPSQSAHAEPPAIGWWRWRQREGVLNRVPQNFYPRVWQLMQHSDGLVIGDKLDRRNRLQSSIVLSQMTAGEKNFALSIDHLLNKIPSADYRQLSIEALMALQRITESNPELQIDGYFVLDVLIGHAVRYAWTSRFPELAERYDHDKAAAWAAFYDLSPEASSGFMVKAFRYLLDYGETEASLVLS